MLRIALYGGALFIGLPLAFAHMMTRTYRGEITEQPAPGYQAVRLVSEDLKLRAWLAEGEPD